MILWLLAAGSASAETPLRTTFRAQGLPPINQSGPIADASRLVLKEFLEQYPQYDIEVFSMPVIAGMTLDSPVLMAIAAGVPPNAIYVNFRQSSTYIEQGFLLPLEVLLARILSENEQVRQTDDRGQWLRDPTEEEVAQALELLRQRVPTPAWPVVYRPDPRITDSEPHVWALPTSNLVMALLYRKDLFFQAGLDPDRPPRDWDEFLEYARRMTVPERRQYGSAYAPGQGVSFTMYTFFVSNGARAVMEDPETGHWSASFDTLEAAEAILYYARLTQAPFERDGTIIRGAAIVSGDRYLLWNRGQVGMIFDYLREDTLAQVNPNLVGIAPPPYSPRGTRGSEVNAQMMGIFAQSTPEQQLAVMRYLWFITSDRAKEIRTRVYVEGGMGQFVNPDLLEQFGYHHLLRQVPEGWQQVFREAMTDGVPEPYGRNTQNIYRILSAPINEALELPLLEMPEEEALSAIMQILRRHAEITNVRVMGIIPPAEMRLRRIVGASVLGTVVLVFGIGLTHIWRFFSRVAIEGTARRHWRRLIWGYVLIVPAMGLVLWWDYLPLVGGLSISLMDYQIVRPSVFVGVDNFANVIFDVNFWWSLLRTFYFVALVIGLGFWPPILLAILLHEVPTDSLKYFFRTVFYLPAVISGVIVMFLWQQLYDPSEYGVLNQLLMSLNYLAPVSATILKLVLLGLWLSLIAVFIYLPIKLDEMSGVLKGIFWGVAVLFIGLTIWPLVEPFVAGSGSIMGNGDVAGASMGGAGVLQERLLSLIGRFEIQPVRWLESPQLAMIAIVIPMVWAASGPGCIIYLAALKTVPDELYEAADIDGASYLHKIFYIVLPRLKFLIVIQFIAAVVAAFKGGTEYIMIMTGGGPNNATLIVALEIFFRTFMELNFGIGTAMAWVMGTLLIGFTAYQLKLLSRAEFKAAG
jgi:ABC-type sugar transport system permease subunit